VIRNDPIVEEIHSVREVIARESGYDIDKVIEAARARQAAEGREAIKLSARKPGGAKRAL
jgi:hypothetical protein